MVGSPTDQSIGTRERDGSWTGAVLENPSKYFTPTKYVGGLRAADGYEVDYPPQAPLDLPTD